jgi:restriction system protein
MRYMGYVDEQIVKPDQIIKGVIIALDDDPKLGWALADVPSIAFYRYQISFKLMRTGNRLAVGKVRTLHASGLYG